MIVSYQDRRGYHIVTMAAPRLLAGSLWDGRRFIAMTIGPVSVRPAWHA